MVAERKNTGNAKKNTGNKTKKPVGLIFWTAFVIVIVGLFLVNREIIQRTLENTRLLERLNPAVSPEGGEEGPVNLPPPPASVPETTPALPPSAEVLPSSPVPAVEPGSAGTATPAASVPASQNVQQNPAAPESPKTVPAESPKLTRGLYFMRVDSDGTILRTMVKRDLPASDSPMLDVLHSLFQGPSPAETRQGLISLIPPGTKILSATVRGSTAYISFSEEFQFNTYGVEGYAAQLRQIIWTVTEFQNIKDVQVLIDGRRVDYLGEGVWIGSPLNRDML